MMSALMSPCETIEERVDRLLSSHSESWPPLASNSTHTAIGEIIGRVVALEEAMREIALELHTLASDRDGVREEQVTVE
jgi:hypothetical protein